MNVTLRLNGRETTLDCDPANMLLDVLQGAGLTSVRETCRIGMCGACTILLDGEPVSGCLTMAAQAQGRAVTTVEGLDGSDSVQRAFVDKTRLPVRVVHARLRPDRQEPARREP